MPKWGPVPEQSPHLNNDLPVLAVRQIESEKTQIIRFRFSMGSLQPIVRGPVDSEESTYICRLPKPKFRKLTEIEQVCCSRCHSPRRSSRIGYFAYNFLAASFATLFTVHLLHQLLSYFLQLAPLNNSLSITQVSLNKPRHVS
jgi:hypothetical protein